MVASSRPANHALKEPQEGYRSMLRRYGRLMIHYPHLLTAEYSGAGITSEHLRNTGLVSASLRIFRISIFTICDIHSPRACKA